MTTPSERFRLASDGFLARISAVRPDQWQSPTPCPAWTVRDVTVHVINEQRRTLSTVRGTAPQPLYGVAVAEMGQLPATDADADLAAAWGQIGSELAQTMDDPACLDVLIPTPMGPTPYRQILDALPEDVLIHTWDIARAIGADETLDVSLVEHVYEHLKPLDDMLRQPWAFGPVTPTPAGADLQTEFLCFVGRRP
jgi:uncharacterized protein (TIGR03086 family)